MRSEHLPLIVALLLAACGPDGGGEPLPPVAEPPPAQKKSGMTWYRDVLPVVQRSCHGCHVAGGIAPFPLTTYSDGMMYAVPMSAAVQARRMPPWMPSGDCRSFQHDRTLAQDEIDTIYSWAQDGAPAGDEADAPRDPPPPPAALPWSDVTLDPGADYTPPERALTDYRCFLLDPKLAQPTDLVGFVVTPGARGQVHHVLLYPADAADARALDDKSPGTGWTCFGGPGTDRTSMVGGWVPGSPPTSYPEGTGIQLQAGQVLVMQIHYDNYGGGAWAADRTTVKLQYARGPVARQAQMAGVRNRSFSVPAGATGYSVEGTLQLPQDVMLHGVAPHAHQQARRLRVETADGCLIDIPRWDFSWQQMYFYDTPAVPLKKGTLVKLTCVYDNPGDKPLRWGESTTEEMCLSYLYLTGT